MVIYLVHKSYIYKQTQLDRRSRLSSKDFCLNSLSALLFAFTRIVLENMIHLLQRSTLGLWNTEECPNPRQKAEDREEDVCTVTGVLDERRRDQADDEIVKPV